MNVLTPTLGLGVGYSERYAQQSKCSNVSTKTLLLPPNPQTAQVSGGSLGGLLLGLGPIGPPY